MITLNGNECFGAGAHIESGLETAIQLARKTGQVVRLLWNGEPHRVRYSDTVKGLQQARHRKLNASPRLKEWRKEQRKKDQALHRHANQVARTLPQWLLVWAISPERAYGQSLSILMAEDALRIVKQYQTAEAIEAAIADGSLVTVADSGGGCYETVRIARLIAKGEFPGQDSTGLITEARHKGRKYYDVWRNPYGRIR